MASQKPPHVMVVEARFYEDIADELCRGALAVLETVGATHERLSVPGAFEIPATIAIVHRADPSRFDGYVALGCVIRGQTTHYDYVCGESARGLQDLAMGEGLAIGYGILTVETKEQAWDRASIDRRNKGADAARACLAMVGIRERFGRGTT